MALPRRALSIQQPYAHLIMSGQLLHTRRAKRASEERVYVYAGRKLAKDERYPLNRAVQYPTGVIVGTVDIVGCEECEDNGYRWLLANAQPFPLPRRVRNSPQPTFWMPEFVDD